MDLYLKVRLAVSEGMSRRQAAKHFNISRDSVAKMLSCSPSATMNTDTFKIDDVSAEGPPMQVVKTG